MHDSGMVLENAKTKHFLALWTGDWDGQENLWLNEGWLIDWLIDQIGIQIKRVVDF